MRPIGTLGTLLVLAAILEAASASAPPVVAPADETIPALAASLADRLSPRVLPTPGGGQVAVGTILDATRAEACLRTIGRASGWPASWLVVSDTTRPYDLVLRVSLAPDGTIADPATLFLAGRRDWDDDAFDAAFKEATGASPPRERHRSLVVQSFTRKLATSYVYDLPATGKGAKGLLAFLPAGSLIREAASIDLRDGVRHTISVVLSRPTFVPADCSTDAGRATGHRDEGGILLALAGETDLEDTLDITELVRAATGGALLPRFPCEAGDTEAGAIDRLVDAKFEGRTPVRLLDFSGKVAKARLDGLPIVVGIKREDQGAFKLFASKE